MYWGYRALPELSLQETQADRQAKNPQDGKNVLGHTHITYIINHWKENLLSFLTAKECMA